MRFCKYYDLRRMNGRSSRHHPQTVWIKSPLVVTANIEYFLLA
ncbi:hypothetical protein [Bacillus haynesii]|nr:hypothetical protein [Bacillus haynesii]